MSTFYWNENFTNLDECKVLVCLTKARQFLHGNDVNISRDSWNYVVKGIMYAFKRNVTTSVFISFNTKR